MGVTFGVSDILESFLNVLTMLTVCIIGLA